MEKDTIKRVRKKIHEDWRLSLRHESASLNLFYGSVIRTVTNVLEMWRVSAG